MIGIDVSFAQVGIDYKKLSEQIDFVIIKCGEKDYTDPQFKKHYNGFKQCGVPIGIYFYGRAQTVAAAQAEANNCASILNGLEFDLPVFYDVEGEPGMAGVLYPGVPTKDNVTSVVKTFLERLSKLGYSKTGIYASLANFQSYIDPSVYSDKTLWIADWRGSEEFPTLNGRKADIWQYTNKKTYSGYGGNLDGNKMEDNSFDVIKGDNKYYFCHPLGMRANDAIITTYSGHGTALDIYVKGSNADKVGLPIYSMTDGEVIACHYPLGSMKYSETYKGGNDITIKVTGTASQANKILNSNDFSIYYAHLVNPDEYTQFPKLKVGDIVRKGQIIGGMGASGHTVSGDGGVFVHLHLDMWYPTIVNQKVLGVYKDKTVGDSIKVGSSLNYAIFSNKPMLVPMYLEGAMENGTDLIQTDKVPNEYYTETIDQNFVTKDSRYGTFDQLMNIIAALAVRETVGPGGGYSEYQLNCIAIYGKLLRIRKYNSTSLTNLLESGGFTGFAGQSLESQVSDKQERNKILELVKNNFLYPDAYGILSEYLYIAAAGPYFNYGYGGTYINSPSIEKELAQRIRDKKIQSHLTIGNSENLIGCVGNTAYFANNNYTKKEDKS